MNAKIVIPARLLCYAQSAVADWQAKRESSIVFSGFQIPAFAQWLGMTISPHD